MSIYLVGCTKIWCIQSLLILLLSFVAYSFYISRTFFIFILSSVLHHSSNNYIHTWTNSDKHIFTWDYKLFRLSFVWYIIFDFKKYTGLFLDKCNIIIAVRIGVIKQRMLTKYDEYKKKRKKCKPKLLFAKQ